MLFSKVLVKVGVRIGVVVDWYSLTLGDVSSSLTLGDVACTFALGDVASTLTLGDVANDSFALGEVSSFLARVVSSLLARVVSSNSFSFCVVDGRSHTLALGIVDWRSDRRDSLSFREVSLALSFSRDWHERRFSLGTNRKLPVILVVFVISTISSVSSISTVTSISSKEFPFIFGNFVFLFTFFALFEFPEFTVALSSIVVVVIVVLFLGGLGGLGFLSTNIKDRRWSTVEIGSWINCRIGRRGLRCQCGSSRTSGCGRSGGTGRAGRSSGGIGGSGRTWLSSNGCWRRQGSRAWSRSSRCGARSGTGSDGSWTRQRSREWSWCSRGGLISGPWTDSGGSSDCWSGCRIRSSWLCSGLFCDSLVLDDVEALLSSFALG
mmetsp:Transcript_22425/g.46745  ORF Transcript_22425/g.46745 Transcript_22425/m.46745 type:complete len:379 (-) Transcript_22425:378-1514(-)